MLQECDLGYGTHPLAAIEICAIFALVAAAETSGGRGESSSNKIVRAALTALEESNEARRNGSQRLR
jgi:hypothetical protein